MHPEILKAHRLVVQKKLSMADFEAFLLGLIYGNRKVNYRSYIRSEAWKKKASAAKKRAGYRCQICNRGKRDGVQLDAHHRTYERLGHERPEDITVLCHRCHEIYEANK
jgi:hypothetical protein